MNEIKKTIKKVLAEARKKKKDKDVKKVVPVDFSHSEAFDFSNPLGDDNLYKLQGASVWGPMTSNGTNPGIVAGQVDSREGILSITKTKKKSVKESAWYQLSEIVNPQNVWEKAELSLSKKSTVNKRKKSK